MNGGGGDGAVNGNGLSSSNSSASSSSGGGGNNNNSSNSIFESHAHLLQHQGQQMQAEALGGYANMMFPGAGGRMHPSHHHLQQQQQTHQHAASHQSQHEHLELQQQHQQQSGNNYNFPMGPMGGGVSGGPSLPGFAGSQATAVAASAGGYGTQQAHHLSQIHHQAAQLPHDTQQHPQGMLPSRGHPFTGYDYNYRAGGYM